MNELRNTPFSETPQQDELQNAETPKAKKQADTKSKHFGGRLKSVLEGSFLVRERVINLLPFLILLTTMGLALIFNSNYATKLTIEISKTKKQNEELRFNYINTKSKLMQISRQSEIAHKLSTRGIKESKIPPRKILVTE